MVGSLLRATIICMCEERPFGGKPFPAIWARLIPALPPPNEWGQHFRQKLARLELVDGVEVPSVDIAEGLVAGVEIFDSVEDIASGEHEIFVGWLAGSNVVSADCNVCQTVGKRKAQRR